MWDSPGRSDDRRSLVIAQVLAEPGEHATVVLALQAPTREAVDALLRDRLAGLDEHFQVQIHDWEFGGRR